MYTPTQFSTVEDKQKFGTQFIKFVESGFKRSLFPKWFYNRLSMTRGHIAHYNQDGFYSSQFGTLRDQKHFLEHWQDSAIYGDPAFTYSDVERFLSNWIKGNGLVERYKQLVREESLQGSKNLIISNFNSLTNDDKRDVLEKLQS